MQPRLPSVQALEVIRRIAAGANLVSIAQELHLTASAVSRRLLSLEESVGVPLIDRRGRRLALTPAGARYTALAEQALALLRQAGETVRASADATLRILSSPSLYANWIAPRLGHFLANWPGAKVELLTEASQLADIRIRSATTAESRPGETRLIDFQVTPFCCPDLIERHAIREPGDICRVPLIEHVRSPHAWQIWFAEAGIAEPSLDRTLTVDSSFMMYEAVLSGAGIAALPLVYAPVHRTKGLIAPFPAISVYLGSAFIAALDPKPRPIVKAFRDWIISEIGNS